MTVQELDEELASLEKRVLGLVNRIDYHPPVVDLGDLRLLRGHLSRDTLNGLGRARTLIKSRFQS